MSKEIETLLQSYFRSTLPALEKALVSQVTSINAGWESDVYTFHLATGAGEPGHDLVLRLYQGSQGSFKAQIEFAGMQRLYQVGYPVPQVYFSEIAHSPFQRPFMVMEKIEGSMLWPVLFSASEPLRTVRLDGFCSLMAQLHQLDWRLLLPEIPGYDGQDPFFFFKREMERWSAFMANTGQAYPIEGFKNAMQWLVDRILIVPCLHPGPVHLDFHPGNVLLTPDERMVVIDWTQVDVTDTRFDLAWTLLLIGSQEGERWRTEILDSYQRQFGEKVEQIDVFEAAACVKRLASVAMSLAAGPEAMGMREGAQASMLRMIPALRRVYVRFQEITGVQIAEIEGMFGGIDLIPPSSLPMTDN